jgi:hypothetical protein
VATTSGSQALGRGVVLVTAKPERGSVSMGQASITGFCPFNRTASRHAVGRGAKAISVRGTT